MTYEQTITEAVVPLSERYIDGKEDLVSLLKKAFDAGYTYAVRLLDDSEGEC
jgi:hypothetical protein